MAPRGGDGRVLYFLLGPEGLWVAISLVAYVFAARNQPSTQAGNEFLETLWVRIHSWAFPSHFLRRSCREGEAGGGWRVWWWFPSSA